MNLDQGTGPLRGIKVVEIAGVGPAPHACMILADLGADVIRVERPGAPQITESRHNVLHRGRPSVILDLKHPQAVRAVLSLVTSADVLVEGMRPGVMERLGLGPADCSKVNDRLVYARMTGWGQDGPLAASAGHDLTYLAVSGALFGLGQDPTRPHFPSNLLGDFGGGSTYLVIGILAALLEARGSGRGQVVDAAILDGVAHLSAMTTSLLADGHPPAERATGILDGGAPFYDLYETSDGRHMAVGALEPQFFATFVELLGVRDSCPGQHESHRHEEMRALFAARFKSRTQQEWVDLFEGTDACVAGVLPLAEAALHPQVRSRMAFVTRDGVLQPGAAPRFSRTAPTLSTPPSPPGADTREALAAWGIADVDELIERGAAVHA